MDASALQPCTTILPLGQVGGRAVPALPLLLAAEFVVGLAYALLR